MAKAIPHKIRLHGSSREILTGEFPSKKAAKDWIRLCWSRPYTLVPINKSPNNLDISK